VAKRGDEMEKEGVQIERFPAGRIENFALSGPISVSAFWGRKQSWK